MTGNDELRGLAFGVTTVVVLAIFVYLLATTFGPAAWSQPTAGPVVAPQQPVTELEAPVPPAPQPPEPAEPVADAEPTPDPAAPAEPAPAPAPAVAAPWFTWWQLFWAYVIVGAILGCVAFGVMMSELPSNEFGPGMLVFAALIACLWVPAIFTIIGYALNEIQPDVRARREAERQPQAQPAAAPPPRARRGVTATPAVGAIPAIRARARRFISGR